MERILEKWNDFMEFWKSNKKNYRVYFKDTDPGGTQAEKMEVLLKPDFYDFMEWLACHQ